MLDGTVPELLEEVVVDDLVESWRRDFRVDVAQAFDGLSTLRLCRDPVTGQVYFDPPVAGTPAFYGQLRAFPWYHPSGKAEHRFAANLIGPGERVLDVGAGEGAFGDCLRGTDYTGLEFDVRCVQAARARGHRVLDRDLASLAKDVREGGHQSYGFVTAFQVLEHLADPDAFLTAARECLAAGGHLILGLPDRRTYVSDLPDFVLNAPPHHLTWWDESSIGALLRRQGLRHPNFYRFPVEAWERRLWWMARTARFLSRTEGPRFGRRLRSLKVFSWLVSGALQAVKPPGEARGATLVVVARR